MANRTLVRIRSLVNYCYIGTRISSVARFDLRALWYLLRRHEAILAPKPVANAPPQVSRCRFFGIPPLSDDIAGPGGRMERAGLRPLQQRDVFLSRARPARGARHRGTRGVAACRYAAPGMVVSFLDRRRTVHHSDDVDANASRHAVERGLARNRSFAARARASRDRVLSRAFLPSDPAGDGPKVLPPV